ncbi:MAG TPA: N-acetyltransferase [Opitutaceae bacterium]|nr:N-acetyltransferase [Opitutaceae bacterium]
MEFALRAVTEEDYAWLWALKRQTMQPYVEQTWGGWDEATQESFFRAHFVPALMQVITVGGRDAGLLHVEPEPAALFLANIQILPEFQNHGVGTAVVRGVLNDARARGKPVRLQVLKTNHAARRLYEQLGFRVTDLSGPHWQMSTAPLPVQRQS